MTRFTSGPLALALILGLSSTAFAQDTAPATDEAAPAAESESETDAPASGADLSLGEEVGDPSRVGTTYPQGEYGDWQLRCVVAPEGQDPCNLYQLLTDESGNDVAEISLFPLPEGGQAVAGATIITPLETLLTEQVTLAVDGGTAKRYPFTFCGQIGCFSRVGLTEGDIGSFKAGAKATLTIVPLAAPDQKVNLNLSLNGFTAGFDAVIEANEPQE